MVDNSAKSRIRKSLALVAISILITTSFAPLITSVPILKKHEKRVSNPKSNDFSTISKLENDVEKNHQWLTNYFCFVIIIGDYEQQNMFIFQIYLWIQQHKKDYPIFYKIFSKFYKTYIDIENRIPLKLSHRLKFCLGRGDVLTIGLNGTWIYHGHGWSIYPILVFGFKGIWLQGKFKKFDCTDFAIGFATCVVAL